MVVGESTREKSSLRISGDELKGLDRCEGCMKLVSSNATS